MEEPFLSWWMVILLGPWAIGLSFWLAGTVNRELRIWSGLLTISYFFLIEFAIGSLGKVLSFTTNGNSKGIALAICITFGSICSMWILGHISVGGRRLCYIFFTISNSLFCLTLGANEIAVSLAIASIPSIKQALVNSQGKDFRSRRKYLIDCFQFQEPTVRPNQSGEFWLRCFTNTGLTLLIMGILSYSVRVEKTRISSDASNSEAREVRSDLQKHQEQDPSEKSVGLIDQVTGPRADIIVLLSAIVFIGLTKSLEDTRQVRLDAEGRGNQLHEFGGQNP